MRTTVVVLLLLGSWLHSYAQKASELLPVKVNAKWGYINAQGTMVIPPTYDAAGYFDLLSKARVVKNGKVKMISFLDGNLKEMQPGKVEHYDDLKTISDKLVAYQIGKKWGLATWQGDKLIPCEYDEINREEFKTNSVITCYKGPLFNIANQSGILISNKSYTDLRLGHGALAVSDSAFNWGMLSYDGEELVECVFSFAKEKDYNYWGLNKGNRQFIFSVKAKRILEHSGASDYKTVPGHPEYLYIISEGGVGILSADDKVLVPSKYDNVKINGDYFEVYLDGKMGLYSNKGDLIADVEYNQIEKFKAHIALVRVDNYWGLINDKGKVVAAPIYADVEVVDNTAKCRKVGSELDIYTISKIGDVTDLAEYENVINVRSYYQANRWRSMSTRNTALSTWQTGWYRMYGGGYYWGYRDSNLEVKIQPEYTRVQDFPEHGFAVVEKTTEAISKVRMGKVSLTSRTRYGIIDTRTYKFIYPPVFSYIDMEPMFNNDFYYTRGLLPDGKFVIITKDGLRLKTKYSYIGKQVNGMSKFTINGIINRVSKYRYVTTELPYGTVEELLDDLTMHFSGELSLAWINRSFKPTTLGVLIPSDTKKEHIVEISEAEWGYLGKDGRPKIKPQYSSAFDFYGSTAIALKGGNYGLIDSLGTTKLPFLYQKIDYLPNSDSQLYRISTYNPSYGVIDSLGNVVVPVEYRRVWDVYNNIVKYKHPTKGYGYININGEAISETKFRNVNDFMGEYATVKSARKWQLMDKDGYIVKELDYVTVDAYSEGLAAVFYSHKYGYINAEGKVEIPSKYKRVNPFNDGYAIVSKNGKKYGYIDTKGNWIHKPKYVYTDDFNEAGLAVVKSPRGYALINNQGDVILKPKYDAIYLGDGGLVTVKKDKNSYLYNLSTEEMKDLGELDAKAFINGYAVYEKGGKYGLIDVNGKLTIEPIYSECTNVCKGNYAAREGNMTYIFSLNNDTIYQKEYARFKGDFSGDMLLISSTDSGYKYISVNGEDLFEREYERAEPFDNGIARVYYKDKWGLINHAGLELVDAKFDKIFDFKNGYAKVAVNYTRGVADNSGNLLFEPEYEHVNYISLGVFRVEKANQVGYINLSGKWLWALQN